DRAFDVALSRLVQTPGVCLARASPIFQTRPVGTSAGGPFFNAAVEIDSSLAPLDLLDLFQDLERRAGRTPGRTPRIRWGPRPLDLDLIFYADEIIELPRLQVPHPACW